MEPLAFPTPTEWSDWLAAHHDTAPEVWVKFHRKGTGIPSIDWEQAVIEALCWGWIDGVRKSVDPTAWMQRYTPRRKRSIWSQKNRATAERLIVEGRMQAPGLAQVRAAQEDGRWEAAYSGGDGAKVPDDFLAALETGPDAAKATFAALDRANLYAIYYRVTTAKRPETRHKRIADLVAMLALGQRPH